MKVMDRAITHSDLQVIGMSERILQPILDLGKRFDPVAGARLYRGHRRGERAARAMGIARHYAR